MERSAIAGCISFTLLCAIMGRFGPREQVEFQALKALCYQGLESAALLTAVGERLAAATRADANCMLELDPDTSLPIYAVSQGWDDDDHIPLIEHALLVSRAADPGLMIAKGPRTAIVDELLPDDEPYYRDPYFAYHLCLRGYRYEVQTVCALRGRGHALLTVSRRESVGTFEPRHLRLIDALAPHVAAGLRAANVRASLAAPVATETGFIILDTAGEIVLASTVGERWLAKADAPGHPGRLWALHVLKGLLERSLTIEGAEIVPEIELADPQTGSLHRLRAEAATTANGDPSTLILIEPVQRLERVESLLRLGLTPREAEVTLGILRGSDIATLAREANVSPHTIVQHLRNVFTKLDVSSRRDLMLRLYRGF